MKSNSFKEKIINLIKNIIKFIKRIPKKVKIICAVILVILLLSIFIFKLVQESKRQKYIEYKGDNLKESKYPGYKQLIDKLIENHPNWNFILFYTKLDWEDVISNEGHSDNVTYPLNLIPDSSDYTEDWKCPIDKDKTFDNGTWLCASNKAIKHQMDPRNILNEEKIFQFLKLQYVESAQTIQGINEITEETFLEGDNISKALIEAGKKANLDPYFVASRLIQEQGRKGTTLSTGYEYNDKVVYNPFNINAKGNTKQEILQNAAEYAYSKGWDSLEKALIGGIEFIKEGYINKGQDTLYLQKFDIVNKDEKLYVNQYMQNLLAPQSEASNMLKIYTYSDTVDSALNFVIPLYDNMPEEISEK